MALLSVLFLLWGVPLLNATGRLRSFHVINTTLSINEALNVCRTNFTDLVTIYDEKENMELVDILNKSVSGENSGWIGASSCKWSNGDSVTFTNTSSRFNGGNDCGAIKTRGRWEPCNCSSTKKHFMCYDQDPGQQSYNYSLIRENKTWIEAQQFCRENHTDLVSIRNETENDRVKDAANGSDSFWIGLRYNNYSIYWLNGGRSDYTQKFSSSEACLTFLSNSSSGSSFHANIAVQPALCYESFIHVSETKMSWEEALDYCDSNYSGLLTIQSEKDQTETERELKRRNISGPVWVGLRQSRLFGFWMWTNGFQMGPWTNWKGGSQPEHQISQHCGAIEKEEDGQYKWCDKDCRKMFRVLCEMK